MIKCQPYNYTEAVEFIFVVLIFFFFKLNFLPILEDVLIVRVETSLSKIERFGKINMFVTCVELFCGLIHCHFTQSFCI